MSGAASQPARRVAILQSNYIPWKGYFDLIRAVDLFIFLDDVQFTKNDWRNRNRIKTAQGLKWLTIPVKTASRLGQTIAETHVARPWVEAHWAAIRQSYVRAPYFNSLADRVRALFETVAEEPSLSRINTTLLQGLCELLDLRNEIAWSWDFDAAGRRGDRVLALCLAAGATHYLSGPAAQVYLDVRMFEAAGIRVEFADYGGYPEYPQLHGAFEHGVSILDLLFNMGPAALSCMKDVVRWDETGREICAGSSSSV